MSDDELNRPYKLLTGYTEYDKEDDKEAREKHRDDENVTYGDLIALYDGLTDVIK